MQGAAFDLPDNLAEEMMSKKEELTSRNFNIDLPSTLPIETTVSSGYDDRGRNNFRGGNNRRRSGALPFKRQ